MAVVVTSSTHAPAPVESRGQAIARVVAERDAKLRETSEAKAAQPAEQAAPSSNAAPAAPEAPKTDPNYLVELERRDRAMDQARREMEDLRRELEASKSTSANLKDWRKALEMGGHKIEDVVQEWLGGEPAAKPTAAPSAPPAGIDPELMRRLERLEQKEQDELRGRARTERRASISALMPEGDDFEVMRALGDRSLDAFVSQLEQLERGRPQGIGPNEIGLLLKEFEGNTRKNIESEFGRLAQSKWAKQIMRKLLDSSNDTLTTGHESPATRDASGPEIPGPESTHGGSRNYKPSGISREQLIARARAAIVARMR